MRGSVAENQTAETQNNASVENSGGVLLGDNNTIFTQVIERKVADGVRKEVDSVVAAVKNRLVDAFLTAMYNVVILRVEMAVRLITGSSRHVPNSVVQNLEQRDFSGIMEDTPLMTASSRTDLDINHIRNRLEIVKTSTIAIFSD